MDKELAGLEPGLALILECIAKTVSEVAAVLSQEEGDVNGMSGNTNTFGDVQLQLDCVVDELIFDRLAACPACCAASSEEQPEMRHLQGNGYTVVFDPLDGSSIVGANFAVGSIFGVWPGQGVVGRSGRQQSAAAYAVYGPRTLLTWVRPTAGAEGPMVVQQWILSPQGGWRLLPPPLPPHKQPPPSPISRPEPPASTGQEAPTQSEVQRVGSVSDNELGSARPSSSGSASWIAPSRPVFAPANLRCCTQNQAYKRLVDTWITRGYTLRYTGGMVPDVHHILAKGGGVFVNPVSAGAPAKLRLVYECAPLALIIEAAGGLSHDGKTSILDVPITSTSLKSAVVLGSSQMVEESLEAMAAA